MKLMEPIQNPTQQPLQDSPEVIVSQPKPNYLIIIISLIFGIVLLALIFLLYQQNQQLQKKVLNQQATPTIQLISSTPKTVSSISIFPDETAGWKTYTSKKLSFSFKYPPEYKVPEENNNYISLISPSNPKTKKNEELTIEIYASEAEPNESLIDFVKKKKEQSDSLGSNTKILKEEEILIDGIKAVKQTWEGMGTGQTILFIKNNKEFGIIKYPAVTTRDNEFDQILSTFKFLDKQVPSPIVTTKISQTNGNIKYILPQGWEAKLNNDSLFISPANGGGYLSIRVYDYPNNIGRREYYCQVSKVCIEGTTYFTEMSIGNISGYMASALDNSGGGSEYLGAKGNKFYLISSYNPPSPNEFEKNYKNVLNSLVF